MAVDRHNDGADGTNNVKPEQPQWRGQSSGDAPAAPEEPAETRTRAECYEALRAADGKPVPASDSQGAQPDTQGNHASWDAIDVGNRPPLDALRVTPERTASLAAHNTPVTEAERDELLALLEATDMPTDPIGKLTILG